MFNNNFDLTRMIDKLVRNKEPNKVADAQLDEYKTKATFYFSTHAF